ncbi:UNVERIFIED_CONTAM: hypothetical protein Slati_1439500 [Sesamum latifolium]|uniref:Uncharacterized protein n=1 Tax=Sesamum latifolium TaxID=2727402 RepID=A0AAW2X7B6_9LAMI
MPWEELEGIVSSHLVKFSYVRSSFPDLRRPPIPQSKTQRRKLEEKVERLGAENAKLKEGKKEATSCCEQLEKDFKRLQKEVAGHEGAFAKAIEKAMLDFPKTEVGQR